MAAAKNNKYNPKGRPVGAKSKKTLQWEQFAEYCMTEGLGKFSTELNRLEKKEYVTAFLNLLDYFKPKLSRHDQKIQGSAAFSLAALFEAAEREETNGR